ncbi:pantoate--beta-alanine ligase [Peribacillus saganii]|uniref:Pantothenate synthetase n=1 Tax=Peribacillus saganii TaxID=2303992 RepID=A0A372LME4_9BACI|nr:pantoate--beta-alanine ligase [Peribacillus saganii]RFU68471.1 pantoate--beta-alanine ligase [Peribacillus saganii]
MKIITRVDEMQTQIKNEKSAGKSIGYVPTMGYLHEGHETLLHKARRENDILILSIFVNPIQFGPNEDYDSYPRDMDRDEQAARNAGADYIFYPTVQEMYQDDVSVSVLVKDRTDVLCGRNRPGHFDGVATVLTKLFHIAQPDRAYFGMKDAQQVAVVKGLVKDFNFMVEIVPVETIREEDGLAKSSRNINLLEEERSEASELYKALSSGKKAVLNGETNPESVISLVREHLENHTHGKIDYVEVYSYPELKPLSQLTGTIIIALAVRFSRARLIDNVVFTI